MTDDVLESRPADRTYIWRNALIYTPGAIFTLALFALSVFGLLSGNIGAALPAFLLGLIGFALGYESRAALRDLRAEPVVTEGEVDRVWRKSKLLVFGRQDYLLVQKQVFEIGRITAEELSLGQVVTIHHWPHTMRVISVARVRTQDPDQD